MAGLAGLLVACSPTSDSGQCASDAECPARGQVCDTAIAECVQAELDDATTAEGTPPTDFTAMPVPFFRGRLCTAETLRVVAGGKLPLVYQPCLHPCMSNAEVKFNHQWECLVGTCEATPAVWAVADGNECPAEAFGRFDPALCDYSQVGVSTQMGPIVLDQGGLETFIDFELPYLTNEDVAEIAAFEALGPGNRAEASTEACLAECEGDMKYEPCLMDCFNLARIVAYPRQDERVVRIGIAESYPVPPEDCAAEPDRCECVDVGFQ